MNAVNPLTVFAFNLIIKLECIQDQFDNICVSIFTSVSSLKSSLSSRIYLSLFWFQCLVIICLVLARTGFNEGTRDLGHFVDEKWLNTATLVSYAFILPIFIITYLLGDIVPVKMVSLLKIDSTCWILHDWLVTRYVSWFIDLSHLLSLCRKWCFNSWDSFFSWQVGV